MKKFLFNLSIFLSLVLIFNYVLYIFYKNEYISGYNLIPKKDFTTFIFADSHGLPLKNYTEKYNAFNFSAGSESYFDIKRKITYLIDNNYIIKKVYLSIDNHTLSKYRENSNNSDRSVFYETKKDFDNYFSYLKNRYLIYNGVIFQPKIRSIFKLFLYKKTISFLKKEIPENLVEKNWKDLSNSEKDKSSKARYLIQFPTKNNSQLLSNTLIEIIKLSKEHNFNLIGIKFPLSRSYIETLNNSNYGADKIFLKNNLPILDYEDLFINKDEFFENQDHLNAPGGEQFSKTLLTN